MPGFSLYFISNLINLVLHFGKKLSCFLQDLDSQSRWLSYADNVFELTGFDGLEADGDVAANPLYKEFNGLLKVLKIPSVSGINLEPITRPLTCDWAFKVRRRKFVLQVRSHILFSYRVKFCNSSTL